MVIPRISKTTIREHCSQQSLERGEDYYQSGAVAFLVLRGNILHAGVEGSQYDPYQVSIHFDEGGIIDASCSCPYDLGGWCKHIVATLLVCLNEPKRIEERTSIEQILAQLTREQLQSLIQTLALEQPGLVDAIERQIALLKAKPKSEKSKKPSRRTSVDPRPFREQVRSILRSVRSYWDDAPALDQIRSLIKKAQQFIEKGDGNNALVIVGAITDAYVQNWTNLEGSSGESGDFFEEMDEALTEAILSADLTLEEREAWKANLETWQADVEEYGINDAFEMSFTALVQHWDSPPLLRVLQGKTAPEKAGPLPEYADKLAGIRLKVLERQKRLQEYLYLAEAKGQMEQYFTMLVRVGRQEEAIKRASTHMSSVSEAFALAKALREQGNLEEALHIAEKGLVLEGASKNRLAIWASELAEGMGYAEQALKARIIAFEESPSLNDYIKVQELAGRKQWPVLQKKLLAILRKKDKYFEDEAKVDIFLHEDLLDEAIETVNGLSSYRETLVQKVMDAAIEKRPDWVINSACRRAEAIMDEAKAKYYDYAIEWLKRARDAYIQLKRQKEWKAYYDSLLQKHARKEKLKYMLQKL